jgi:hypothetical protein
MNHCQKLWTLILCDPGTMLEWLQVKNGLEMVNEPLW